MPFSPSPLPSFQFFSVNPSIFKRIGVPYSSFTLNFNFKFGPGFIFYFSFVLTWTITLTPFDCNCANVKQHRFARLWWMCLRTPPSLSVARRSSPPRKYPAKDFNRTSLCVWSQVHPDLWGEPHHWEHRLHRHRQGRGGRPCRCSDSWPCLWCPPQAIQIGCNIVWIEKIFQQTNAAGTLARGRLMLRLSMEASRPPSTTPASPSPSRRLEIQKRVGMTSLTRLATLTVCRSQWSSVRTSPTPTRGTLLAPFATPSSTPTKLRWASN